MIAVPQRCWVRVAFWCWAAILFTGTHWPRLELPFSGRPDLWVHLTIFGLWASLLLASGYYGPPTSWRNIGVVVVVGLAYGAVDEGLQAIPWVHRHAALDDWALDATGVLLACLGAAVVGRVTGRGRSNERPDPGTLGPRHP